MTRSSSADALSSSSSSSASSASAAAATGVTARHHHNLHWSVSAFDIEQPSSASTGTSGTAAFSSSSSSSSSSTTAAECVPQKVHPADHACVCAACPQSLVTADPNRYSLATDLTDAEADRRKIGDTSYILTGYRTNHSLWDCARSVFAVHNETLNIWTHLGAFLYWAYVFSTLERRPWYTHLDALSQGIMKAGHGIILLMPLSSATYHTFCDAQTCCCFHATSRRDKWSVANVFLRADLLGIYALFYARSLMEGYLALFCNRHAWLLFQMLSMLTFAVLAPVGLWTTQLWPMVPSFVLVHVPLLVMLFRGGWWASPALSLHVLFSLAGTACFAVAFAIYTRRWPESRWPGRFDIVGSSHQLWHVLTWLGPELILIGMRYHVEHLVGGDPCAADEAATTGLHEAGMSPVR